MNTRKVIVLVLAAFVAGAVALMVRGFFGGGTKQADARPVPPPVEVAEVLVAATRLEPGQPLTAAQVRWQQWPAKSIDPSFIRKSAGASEANIIDGTVVRAPMVEGEPITNIKIVKSDAAGFMAATLAPGMRAVAISVSVATVAGGFIQPNDRVDLLLTVVSDRQGVTRVVVPNVRVLAIDQAFDGKNQKAVSDVKTVTLELTPAQAQATAQAQAMGTLSLALRGLGDNQSVASGASRKSAQGGASDDESSFVSIIRYGMTKRGSGSGVQ